MSNHSSEQPIIIPFPRRSGLPTQKGYQLSSDVRPIESLKPSESGWNSEDLRCFFEAQTASISKQVRQLQDQLILSRTGEGTLGSEPLSPEDPISRTRNLREFLESTRHLLDLTGTLANDLKEESFDLTKMIQNIWKRYCESNQEDIDFETNSDTVHGCSDQIQLALSLLLVERLQEKSEISISVYSSRTFWEIEISDSNETVNHESLAVRTAQRVASNHGGNFSICNCPQGGIAFSISIPSQSMKRAA